ncbi:MAG: peptide ABC transporter substrate-binding protein [Anaerolineae bacterium]|nr:peptide ABC transporter substrate-binding protein [Gemmatimonadaceae bacterium]
MTGRGGIEPFVFSHTPEWRTPFALKRIMKTYLRNTFQLVSCAFGALACQGDASDRNDPDSASATSAAGGTMVTTVGADADFLLPPFVATVQGNQIADIVYERLAEPSPALNTVGDDGFTAELAEKWTWSADSLSIAFSVHPRARWHDGRPVTARDVAFTYDLTTDPATASGDAPLLSQIDSVTVRDSMTAVFWYGKRYPEQFFDAAYQMRILPEHILSGVKRSELRTAELIRKPVGSGRFRFVRWVPGSLVELVADTTHHKGRPKLDRLIWTISPDYNASAAKLFAGDADFIEYLTGDKITEIAKYPRLRTLSSPSLDHVYLHFNLRDPKNPARPHPVFGDVGVRRALAMAVDRASAVQNVFDSLGLLSKGPMVRAQSLADTTIPPIPFNLDGARRLLDSLGWTDANNDGVREKNGKPLAFTIGAPSSSTNRMRMAVLLQGMFKEVGAQVTLKNEEMTTWIQGMQSGKFDAAMNASHLDPSPVASTRQTWSAASARNPAGRNFGRYANPRFDALIDSASVQMNPANARRFYRQAHETIMNDVPAIWLYELVSVAGIDRRIEPVGIRADAWWAEIGDWSIRADQRIARDSIGLRPVAR